jgi:protoheme IX farnesyltransferase
MKSALGLSALFILSALRVLGSNDDRPAKQMFGFSILYLFALFALLIVDRAG